MGEKIEPSTPGVSRRSILKSAAGFGALLAAGEIAAGARAKASDVQPAERQSVIVLGAGMSGLVAGLLLHRAGHDVTILEYQNRVGGRIWSQTMRNGLIAEHGAGHFKSNMPHVFDLISRHKLPLVSLNAPLTRYQVDGKTADSASLFSWPWDLNAIERRVGVPTAVIRYFLAHGFNMHSVLADSWPSEEIFRRLDGITIGELLKTAGASDAFIQIFQAHIGEGGVNIGALSGLPNLAFHLSNENSYRIADGNQKLPAALAALLGDRIILEAVVRRVAQRGGKTEVTTADGKTFRADRVVCTIPPTVLNEVDFQPALSEAKLKSISQMTWAKTLKVFVQTRTPSWMKRKVYGWPMVGSDRSWQRAFDVSDNQAAGGLGTVFFSLEGGSEESFVALPKSRRATAVIEAFQTDNPDLFDEVVASESFYWGDEPWIRASLGGPGVRQGWMYPEWAKPEGRIHFAGDWTTCKRGWTEGAIISGIRAARQIDPAASWESLGA